MVKCLLYKRQDLSRIPRARVKGWAEWPVLVTSELGGRKQGSLGLTGQPGSLFGEPLVPVRDPVSKHKAAARETA